MATEPASQEAPQVPVRGIDGWMRRYSRWRERRLTHLAETPLSSLALQNLFLCVCILIDGVLIPWIVVLLEGDFSLALFAVLFVPSVVAEGLVYLRIKGRAMRASENR